METGLLLMVQEAVIKSNTYIKKLSIQVRLDGLSFCALNCADTGHDIIWYKRTSFSKEHNPVKLLEKIEEEFKNESHLRDPVDEVIVLFSNELYSIVPSRYFKEEDASTYLKFNTKILKTDVVAHDNISNIDLVNVYIPYTNITNFFFDKFGEFEFKHNVSVFIQEIMDLTNNGDFIYLNNYNGYYDLVVLRNNKLLLSNTFNYTTPEDFIYYLLFTAEQLKMDPDTLKLILLGNIEKESPLFEITYTYIKNVDFFNPQLNISEGEYNNKNYMREEFILLKSLGCE